MISLLTNKHVVIAFIVAPILAVLAYFAVDHTVSEKPKQAVEGQSYPLVAKSNCRYESGQCTLENGDISVSLQSQVASATQLTLQLNADLPLQGVKIALSNDKALQHHRICKRLTKKALYGKSIFRGKI